MTNCFPLIFILIKSEHKSVNLILITTSITGTVCLFPFLYKPQLSRFYVEIWHFSKNELKLGLHELFCGDSVDIHVSRAESAVS